MHAIRPRITTRARQGRARSKLLALIVMGAVGAALAFAVQPALAHQPPPSYHGQDVAWGDHRWVLVEDRECDGHAVYAELYEASGRYAKIPAWSCESGWGPTDAYDSLPSSIVRFRACEQGEGCGPWRFP